MNAVTLYQKFEKQTLFIATLGNFCQHRDLSSVNGKVSSDKKTTFGSSHIIQSRNIGKRKRYPYDVMEKIQRPPQNIHLYKCKSLQEDNPQWSIGTNSYQLNSSNF